MFLCDRETEAECIDRRLFGTKPTATQEAMVSGLRPSTRLFLFNTRTRVMLGPFRPVGQAGMHLQPQAWNGQFALQVQVGAELGDGEIRHLTEERLRRWLVYGSHNPRAFTQSLNREQAPNPNPNP